MRLSRPLIAIDVETHAKVSPEQARICEIGFHIDYPDGNNKEWVSYVNPGVSIEDDATTIHHITNEMVVDAPLFKEIAHNLAKGFSNCDFAGYNVRFDLRVIAAEMTRAGVTWSSDGAFLLDGLRLWQVIKPRTLSDAVREFLHREPTEAHRALGDAKDALSVCYALQEHYKLPNSLEELHKLCFPSNPGFVDQTGKLLWSGGKVVIGFGKHRGVALKDVPRSYLEWIVTSDFPPDTKQIVQDALKGRSPQGVK